MLIRDVRDQLLDQDCLAHAGAAEQTDLTASLVRAEEIDDLDPCLEHFRRRRLLLERGRWSVDRLVALCLRSRFVIYRFAKYVKHTSKCTLTHRNRDRRTCRNSIHPSHKSVSRSHGDTSHCIITQMLCNLDRQLSAITSCDLHCIVQLRKLPFAELHIKNRTDNLGNFTNYLICHLFVSSLSYF